MPSCLVGLLILKKPLSLLNSPPNQFLPISYQHDFSRMLSVRETRDNINKMHKKVSLKPSLRGHTVAVESPESSVATFKPFEMVVTLVSGTLYNDCNEKRKCKIPTGKNIRSVFLCVSELVQLWLKAGRIQ